MKFTILPLLILVTFLMGNDTKAQTIDSSFAVNGMIPYGTTGNSQQNLGVGNKMITQPDGKMVVAIDKMDPNGPTDLYFYTYRYNADGTTDTTYGVWGASKIFTGSSSKNKDLKMQPDGKIIVVGESEYCINGICGAPQFVMMRILPNGKVDSSFGTNGVVLSDDIFGSTGTYASPIRVQLASNNKYIIAGKGPAYTQFIARLNSNGTIDHSFANNGIYLDSTVQATMTDLVIDAQENIYALYLKYTSPLDTMNYADNYVLKLAANGQAATTFGTNGKVVVNVGNDERPSAIALRNDGKIVVVGTVRAFHYAYGILDKGYVFILNQNGSMSNLLNGGSTIQKITGDSTTFFQSITITPNNEMLIGGNVTTKIAGNYHQKALLALMKDDASLDNNFNANGYMILDHGLHAGIGSLACILDAHLLPNQKIICSGYRNPIAGNVKRSVYLLQLKNSGIGSASGIGTVALEDELLIYPNPSNGVFYLTTQADKIEVFNGMGSMIYSSKNVSQFDLSMSTRGVYYVHVYLNGIRKLGKIIKE